MSKVLGWFLGMTKIGRGVEKVRGFLWGKKTYVAGAALAVPALVTIIQKFSDQGAPYLMGITATPEYHALLEGAAIIAGRAAITKAVTPAP